MDRYFLMVIVLLRGHENEALAMQGPAPLTDNVTQIIKELVNCPEVKKEVFQECTFSQYSCKDRCGSYSFVHLAKFEVDAFAEANRMCSCDAVCQVYDDCCWDFDRHCPVASAASLSTYSHLAKTPVVCYNGYQIITGCNLHADKADIQYEAEDARQPIISVVMKDNSTLHYKNQSVFLCNHPHPNQFMKIIRWMKNVSIEVYDTGEDYQRFILTGTKSSNSGLKVFDVPLDSLDTRHCSKSVIKCNKCLNLPMLISDVDFSRLCRKLEEEEGNKMKEEEEKEKGGAEEERSMMTRLKETNQPIIDVRSENDSTSNQTLNLPEREITPICTVELGSYWSGRLSSSFSILLDIPSIENMHIVSHYDNGKFWDNIQCLKGLNMEINASCQASMTCISGYASFDRWRCAKPTHMSVQVESKLTDRLSFLMGLVDESLATIATEPYIKYRFTSTQQSRQEKSWEFLKYPFKDVNSSCFALSQSFALQLKNIYSFNMFLPNENITACIRYLSLTKCVDIVVDKKLIVPCQETMSSATPGVSTLIPWQTLFISQMTSTTTTNTTTTTTTKSSTVARNKVSINPYHDRNQGVLTTPASPAFHLISLYVLIAWMFPSM